MDRPIIYLTELQCFILYAAIERERKILEIVTAEEREDCNRDGWALARIKIRELGGVIQQVVRWMPRAAGAGYVMSPETEEDLAVRVEHIGQKMRPPRAELERQMSVKARRREAVRKVKPAGRGTAEARASDRGPAAPADEAPPERKQWAAPKCN